MPPDDTHPQQENIPTWAPRLGQLSVTEAAACMAGSYTLAQHLTKRGEWIHAAGIASLLGILLERELDKIDSPTMASSIKAGQTLIDVQPLLLGLTAELYAVAHELPMRGDPDYGDLAEVCLRLVVASGDPSLAPDALLELGAAWLHRSEAHDADVAAQCYEQLIHAESPYIRVHALYGAAQAHLALSARTNDPKEWVPAHLYLLALAAVPDSDFGDTGITRSNATELLTTVSNLMARAGIELTGGNTQEGVSGL